MKQSTRPVRKWSLLTLALVCLNLFIPDISTAKKSVTKPVAAVNETPVAAHGSWYLMAAASYERLNLGQLGLSHEAFNLAIEGMERLQQAGRIANDRIISIVDFSLPSSQKRLFIIDLEVQRILFRTYVAHGQRSGTVYAKLFSNKPESHQSSPGFYLTAGTYNGGNGYSMQLIGLDKGINDKAFQRAIVMHGAPYVHEGLVKSQGYIGRSHGCPAVSEKLNKPIIETIKNGTVLFIYPGTRDYARKSTVLNGKV